MEYTERTQVWLDQRINEAAGRGTSRRPYYSGSSRVEEVPVDHVLGVARALSVLESLSCVDFGSCLDVGAGTGWLAHLIRRHFGVAVSTVDLSREFCVWSRGAFGFPAHAANAAGLPFRDDTFDVVVCSEVIEHVEHPLAVLGELRRVARRAVVVTTQESCLESWERRMLIASADDSPHAERNYFMPADFVDFFGANTEVRPLMRLPERVRLFGLGSIEELAACVLDITGATTLERGSYGVVAVAHLDECRRPSVASRNELLSAVLACDRELGGASGFETDWPPPTGIVAPVVLGEPRPVCPACLGDIEEEEPGTRLQCAACGAVYAIDRGAPILLAPESVVSRNDACQLARPELADFARALGGPRWSSAPARLGLRAALRLHRFMRSPINYKDKSRLVWRVLFH